jgi:hypothetical protein
MLSGMEWVLYSVCLALLLYAGVVAAFLVAGRREDDRAVAGFVPDCVVLFSRLLRDERLPRRHKLLVAQCCRTWSCRSTSFPTSSR